MSRDKQLLDVIARQSDTIKDLSARLEKATEMSARRMGELFHAHGELQNANRGIHNLRKRLDRARSKVQDLEDGRNVIRALHDHLRSIGVDISEAMVYIATNPQLIEQAKQNIAREKREAYESAKKEVEEHEPVGAAG